MEKENFAIRWHSRAGQGAITAADFFAENCVRQNLLATSFPDFGAEKRGAAVQVFNKISRKNEIFVSDVAQPTVVDGVVLLDETLAKFELGYATVLAGLNDDGFLLINTNNDLKKADLGNFRGKIFTIKASQIAKETISRNIPNVPIVGALTNIMKLDFAKSREILRENLSRVFSLTVVEKNLIGFERGFNEITNN